MPAEPGSAQADVATLDDLDEACAMVADVISRLSRADWDQLCREENAAVVSLAESFERFGWPSMADTRGPELCLGERIVDMLCERHEPPR